MPEQKLGRLLQGAGWRQSPSNRAPGSARNCVMAPEAKQILFLLGHDSIQTTEKYLGCRQRLRGAVNDRIGIEPVQ
jgi:hypothetical protein